MSTFEASMKFTDPDTGSPRFDRLFTMRAHNATQVMARARRLGLHGQCNGELIVYRF